jgi:hypothetical protein
MPGHKTGSEEQQFELEVVRVEVNVQAKFVVEMYILIETRIIRY